ncbi:MAG: hypothetical protein DRI48_03375, partial [Chloroflexi bacterium]
GAQTRINTFPNGAQHQALIGVDASTRITFANGAQVYERRGGDPRFGLQTPLLVEQRIETPTGRAYELARQRAVTDGDVTTYTYNANGTLASVQTGGQTITYRYDARGRRVARSVDGVRTHAWLYGAGLTPLAEYDGEGEVTIRRLTEVFACCGGLVYTV